MDKTDIPTTGTRDDEPCVVPIPLRRDGTLGHCDSRFLIKRAGDDWLHGLTAEPGHRLLHVVALGATEAYGPNRNGDGFTKAACRQYHDTFCTTARWYNDHASSSHHYGMVKRSRFNERLSRVELVVSLYATKEAAELAEGRMDTGALDLLDSDRDIPVSMGCKVAYDVCSYCGNKAKNARFYCTAQTCEAGGLATKMGRVVQLPNGDLCRLYADNPHPQWGDISRITKGRQADRIAYVQNEIIV